MVKVGVLLPTRELAIKGSWDPGPALDFAREAEDAGFDSVWIGDSLLARPRLDALLMLPAVAAATRRVTIGTACLIPALRHPVLGASMVAAAHQATGDRFELAVGSGFSIPWVEKEFTAAGVPFGQRFGRVDELVRIWQAAWSGEKSFEGRYWQVDDLDRLPPPYTPGGPRLWYAGQHTPRVVDRVARLYDGWLPFMPSPDDYAGGWKRIQELCVEYGRPADAVFPGMYATICVNEDREQARADLEDYVQHYYGYPLEITSMVQAFGHGTADECADFLARYVQAGARHLVIRIGTLRSRPSLKEILAIVRSRI